MITVAVNRLKREGNVEKVGDIIWDGKRMSTTAPDSTLIRNIMTQPVWLAGGQEVSAKDDPELFMRSLYLMYHNSYVHCERAVET
jgi:hypothetical protein